MEHMNEFAFMGLFYVLSIAIAYIYIVSTKLSKMNKRMETVESVVNSGNVKMLAKLTKLKETIESEPIENEPVSISAAVGSGSSAYSGPFARVASPY